jgi:hypothetical protein
LACNTIPQRVFQGQVPGHQAFVLSPSETAEMLRKDEGSSEVLFSFLVGRDLLTGTGQPHGMSSTSRISMFWPPVPIQFRSSISKPKCCRIESEKPKREHLPPVNFDRIINCSFDIGGGIPTIALR